MSKDTSSAHAVHHAGNPATLTLAAEQLGIVPPVFQQHVPNHSIDIETGFLESNGYANAFDATRKLQFLELYRLNSLGFRRACNAMGISHDTVHRAVKIDPAFKGAFDRVEQEYIEDLESKSRSIALTNDKATLERIFQLRALRPEKYARENMRDASTTVTLNITGFSTDNLKNRQGTIDVETVKDLDAPPSDLQITMHNSNSSTEMHSSTELYTHNSDGNTTP